jgi:MFS transporter, ACS family, glucarate transporter
MKQRYQVLMILAILSVITFLDRIAIGVAGTHIMTDVGITKEQWGWILGIFAFAYGSFEIPTGLMGDRLGAKRVLIRVVLWWSAFTLLTGLASGFAMLLIVRFLFGIGEAGAYPNTSIVLAKWFPATERARVQAWIWGASRIGGAITPLVIVPIQHQYGWRMSFYFLGLLGIAWVVFWAFWHKEDPTDCKRISKHELDEILTQRQLQASKHGTFSWSLFRNKQLWLLMAMYYCYASGAFFFQSWLSTYLQKGWKLSETVTSSIIFFAFILAAISCLTGGFVSDSLSKKIGTQKARRYIGIVGLGLSGLCLLAAVLIADKTIAMFALGLALALMDFTIPASWATAMDIGGTQSGTATGAMNTAGLMGGTINTISFGYIVSAFGNNYDAPVILLGCLLIIGGVLWISIDGSNT